ncbi:protein PTD [Dorcoceras hygrometricum]|uniref:Protein PTD n=1 Tax=Dorcoceras hygrometricum TaxID=472368 RepID=A0A2Z7BQ36_9LAMI|nr:protein PTD [Dorcoceras hygrometricum]
MRTRINLYQDQHLKYQSQAHHINWYPDQQLIQELNLAHIWNNNLNSWNLTHKPKMKYINWCQLIQQFLSSHTFKCNKEQIPSDLIFGGIEIIHLSRS